MSRHAWTARAVAVPALLLLTLVLWGCGTQTGTGGTQAGTGGTQTGTGGTQAGTGDYKVIVLPQDGYQPVYDFIAGAKNRIDMTMYQLADPTAQAALKAAAQRGVTVRVLLDSDPEGGGGMKLNQAAYDDLNANGVQARWAWSGTLWHQKSITRDGDAAAVMTCNLYAPLYTIVRDYAVITHSTATAAGMQDTFNKDWDNTGSPPTQGVIPAGSELIWSPGAEPGLVELIDSARPGTTLYAEDEQLDSPPIEQALIAAVQRGVTVNLTMTYSSSYVAGFNTLAAGGVHVSLYQPTAPLYIHAKAISVNNETVYVGSSNFTTEMTDQNRNAGIITNDPTVVRGITSTMAEDFAGATPYSASP
ncbi:MAG: phospholipase D-like domain-containing protein [Thermoleophilia bacterium]